MNNEERLYRELSKFFKRLKKEVLASLEEYWSDYQMLQGHINLIVSPVHEAHKEYYEILRKYKVKEYELGKREATRLCNRAGVRYAFKETISMPISGFIKKDSDKLFGTLPKAEQDLLDRTYKTSEKTLNRVDGQLNKIITDGYRSGKGINDIANQVTKRFDQLSSWEAKRIARTEVNTSHNKATVDTYNDLGVEYTQWIAAADDRTRDSHVEVDGEIIPLGGHYSNGLAYPGDMSGPIEEWINCRCSNAPFVIPFGYMAPSFSPFRESDLIPIIENPVEPTQEQIDTNLTTEQKALYNKYQQNISDAQKVVDGLFSTPNERLQAQHLIETETIKLNQLKMIAHGELAKGIATVLKVPVAPSNQIVEENNTPTIIEEPIDMSILEDNGGTNYTIPTEHLTNINGDYYINGLKIDSMSTMGTFGKISKERVLEWNKQFESTPEIISTSDLIMSGSDNAPAFIVDPSLEGFKIVGGKAYYKGLDIKNYDFEGNHGKIFQYEIEKHNKDLALKDIEVPSLNKVQEVMSPEFVVKYEELKEQIEWAIDTQTSPFVSATGKKMALEILENELPNFKKLNEEVLEKLKETKQAPEEYFSAEDLFELPEEDGYLLIEDPSLLKFNEKTGEWEYKGVEVDYWQDEGKAYMDIDVAQEFLDNLDKGFDPHKLTMKEILELEKDPYGDYMIDEDHKVIFNEETGSWEYKGVELMEYDEYDHTGYIDETTMEEYIDKNNLKGSVDANEMYIPDILSVIEDDVAGTKSIVDETGRTWEIDVVGKLEYEQDNLQHQVHFNEYRRKSGEFWGHYGHQQISNLLYGDSQYSDYYKYKNKMDTKVIPLLNKMRDKFEEISEIDADTHYELKKKKIDEYIELHKNFEELANSFDDFEVTKLLYKILDIDEIIIGSPRLLQDTALVRYGHFDESMCVVGETFSFEGFLSTSYDDMTQKPDATSHFADKPNRWKIIILTPEGTRGTRLNNQFNALTTEREWLLAREQEFEVVWHGKTPDPTHPTGERNTVVIRLPD